MRIHKKTSDRLLTQAPAMSRMLLATTACLLLCNEVRSQELPIVVDENSVENSQPATFTDEDRRAWEARVRVNLVSKPEYYPSLLRVFRQPTNDALDRELAFKALREEEYEDARTTNTQYLNTFVAGTASLPLGSGKVDITARVGEVSSFQSAQDELHKVRLKEESLRRGASALIESDVGQFDSILREASRLEFKVGRGEALSSDEQIKFDAFNKLVRANSPQMPTRAGSREQIIKTSSAPDKVRALLEEETGKPEIFSQVINEISTTQITFNQELGILNFGAAKPKPNIEEIDETITRLKERSKNPNTSDDMAVFISSAIEGLEKQKTALQLDSHRETMRNLQDANFAIAQGAQLLFPNDPDAMRAVQLFDASTKIYDGVAQIAISGLTTGGVGAILAGASIVAGMMQSSGPTADQIQIEMLKEILEKLVVIQSSIDSQSRKLNQLVDAIEALEDRNFVRFDELRNRIISGNERLETLIREFRQAAEIQRGPTRLKSLLRSSDQLNFNSDGVYSGEYDSCVKDQDNCSDSARQLHVNFVLLNNDLFGQVTGGLRAFPEFSQDRRISSFSSRTEISEFERENVFDTKVGDLLTSMAVWLNAQRPSGKFPLIDDSKLSKLVAPAAITSVLMPAYVASTNYVQRRHFGSANDLRSLRSAIQEIELGQDELRKGIPLAAAVLAAKLAEVTESLDYINEDFISAYNSNFIFDELGKRIDVNISPYSGRSSLFEEFSAISTIFPDSPDDKHFLHKLSQFLLDADVLEVQIVNKYMPFDPDAEGPLTGYDYFYYLSPDIKPMYNKMLDEAKLSRNLGLDGRFLLSYFLVNQPSEGVIYKAQQQPLLQGLLEIVAYAMDEFEKNWLNKIERKIEDPQFEAMLTDYARSLMVYNTFLEGGYGECIDDPNLLPMRSLADLAEEANLLFSELKFVGKKPGYGLEKFRSLLDVLSDLEFDRIDPLIKRDGLSARIPDSVSCGFGYANVADGYVGIESIEMGIR